MRGTASCCRPFVLRTTGRVAGVVTLLLDIAKGWFAVWLAGRLTDGSAFWMSSAALAVMAGACTASGGDETPATINPSASHAPVTIEIWGAWTGRELRQFIIEILPLLEQAGLRK